MFALVSMSGPRARVALLVLLVLCQCALSVRILRGHALRVREEWRDVERLMLPQLRLSSTLLQPVFVRMQLRVRPLVANESLRINFGDSETGESYSLHVWKRSSVLWWVSSDDLQQHKARIQTSEKNRTSHQAVWVLRFDCFPARSGSTVSVSVLSEGQLLVSQSHIVQLSGPSLVQNRLPDPRAAEEPVPRARVSVDERLKRFSVFLQTEQTLRISLCYKRSYECEVFLYQRIDPPVDQIALSFPSLVPCVCVQLWFTHTDDARRNTQCPLKEKILPHGGDILSSSSARVLGSVLKWEPLCPDDQSDPSVSLCWRINAQISSCVPAPNATLSGTQLEYNVSAVDQHPQMCVKFSLNGSHRVFCPFESEGRSEWAVAVVPGSLLLHVLLTSEVAAAFDAQLCSRDEETCEPRGPVVSLQLDGGALAAELSLPFPWLSSDLCVQVWRVDLVGRRIICPDYTHQRWGLLFAAALTLLTALTALICVSRWLIERTSVLQSAERRPVLLVCSSDDAPHVSAVCSLASGLQGELRLDVRLAQWAQCQTRPSLGQLGPVPWLYGQCQAVQKAGGLVLIAWSPDAHRAFLRWRKSEGETGLYGAVEEEERRSGEEEWKERPAEASSITAPVFSSALSCLWTGIRSDGHGRGFRLLCFQSLNSKSTRIPKPLRCVRKYCLPKDLSSFIHDLTGSPGGSRGRCWPRLLSKALSFFMSRKLAPRLEARLPVPTDSPKLARCSSRKSLSRVKRKTWRQKKRRSKVV